MKCKYKFPAIAHLTFETGVRFEQDGRTYELEVEEGVLVALTVTVNDYADEYLPTITPLTNQVAKANITIPEDPYRDQIIQEVRAMEGGLCVWGVEEIDVEEVTIEWIPESDADKKKLQLFSFKTSTRGRSDRLKSPAGMDVLVRTMMIRRQFLQWETPLNFYRRGKIDLAEGRYIEAIYDLYFSLETMFAEGKFKTRQVISAFQNSKELVEAIDYLKAAKNPMEFCPRRYLPSYTSKFLEASMVEIIKSLVETRGFLHHHTGRRQGMWHPAKQREYHLDAIIFANICTQIFLKRINDLLFAPDNFNQFWNSKVFASNGNEIKWHMMSEVEFEEYYRGFV